MAAGLDERATTRIAHLLDDEGGMDRLRDLLRECRDADSPAERALSLKNALDEWKRIGRALSKAERECRDASILASMKGRESGDKIAAFLGEAEG